MRTWKGSGIVRRRMGSVAALTAAAVLLAACFSGPNITARQRTDQAWFFVSGVMVTGPMLVVVQGDPYAVPPERFSEVVLEEMVRAITWNDNVRFTTDAEAAGSQRMRIIMAFNSGPGGTEQCRGQLGGGGPAPGGAVRLNATLCDADVLLSDVSGSIAQSNGIDDEAFRTLVRQTTTTLLPFPREPSRDRKQLM